MASRQQDQGTDLISFIRRFQFAFISDQLRRSLKSCKQIVSNHSRRLFECVQIAVHLTYKITFENNIKLPVNISEFEQYSMGIAEIDNYLNFNEMLLLCSNSLEELSLTHNTRQADQMGVLNNAFPRLKTFTPRFSFNPQYN